jgi:hypothetical protein
MAPVEVTSILFKDFVNDGKVPEDNFVVNKEHSIDPDTDLKDGQIFLRLLYIWWTRTCAQECARWR